MLCFEEFIHDPEVLKILSDLDIDESNIPDLFDLLDATGSGVLHVEDVITGFSKLRGDPRRSDIVSVGLVMRKLQDSLKLVEDKVLKELQLKEDSPFCDVKSST